MTAASLPEPADRIILFDGVCRFCNAWANFIIEYDRRHAFRLCSVQSVQGARLLEQFGYPSDSFSTLLLVEGGRCYVRSEAVFRVMAGLGWPWRLLTVLRLVPAPLRDWLYDRVALNRYALFGRYDQCRLPTLDHAGRFLDAD